VKLAAIALTATGCAQVLGIHNTHEPPTDAASLCDDPPDTCVSMTGRTACGQLYTTGAGAGRFHVDKPTGAPCNGSTDGPCALAVAGQTLDAFQVGTAGRIAGTLDDCGRFVVPDLDPTAPDVAIIVTGAGFAEAATLVLSRPNGPGVDTAIKAYTVTTATSSAWSTQLSGADVSAGFVVAYESGAMLLDMEEVRVDGAMVMGPPTPPWAAYFSDATLETLDPTATETGTSGSAFVVPTATSMTIGGKRMGATCKLDGMTRVGSTVQFVTLTGC
jgi:hypothetical protein